MRDTYFEPIGIHLLGLEIIFLDHLPNNSPACTDYNKIYINTNSHLFSKYNALNMSNLLLLHENMHIIFDHKYRTKDRDPDIWNYACDFLINMLLYTIERESRHTSTEKTRITMGIEGMAWGTEILISNEYSNIIEEDIYDLLIKENYSKEVKYFSYDDFVNNKLTLSSGTDSPSDDKCIKVITTTVLPKIIDKDGVESEPIPMVNTRIEFPDTDNNLTDQKKTKIRENTELAKTILATKLSRGDMSADVKLFLGKLFNTTVDWTLILRDSVNSIMTPSVDFIWSKPRPLWMVNSKTIPYLPTYGEEETYGTLIVSIDESGSISNDDIRKCVDIIRQSKKYYKSVYVIKHDVKITWEKEYDEIGSDDINDLLVRRGYGGTSHETTFEKISDLYNTKGPISLYIGITDMMSDIEKTISILPSGISIIWIVNHAYGLTAYDKIPGRKIKV